MGKKKVKNLRPVVMDILSVIYQSTLRVGSGHTPEAEEFEIQFGKAKKLVGKHGINDTLGGLYYALLTMSKEEFLDSKGHRTGRVLLKVGKESYALRPYFKGLDSYFYQRWPGHIDRVKMEVCNAMCISVEWGIQFLNFPYNPEQPYQLDIESQDVSIDVAPVAEVSDADSSGTESEDHSDSNESDTSGGGDKSDGVTAE